VPVLTPRKKVYFIRQANTYERAARALGRIDQWRRDFRGLGGSPRAFEQL
jgi:hypothetical protein